MFGVLSINKRNLFYVNKWNSSSSISLAKNKYKSKKFFDERGVPVPETYALIESYMDLLCHDFSHYPDRFVVKPNKGSKGNGIMIVNKVTAPQDYNRNNELSWIRRLDKKYKEFVYPKLSKSDRFFKVGGVIYSELDFKYACARILHGSYSLSKKSDSILVEECLVPGKDYQLFCEYGLADVRVIVFNRVPIAAMVRIPTKLSEGKANIAQGGVACGVNIATGKIDTLWDAGVVYGVNDFPDSYSHFSRYSVPFWQEILMYSSTVQYFFDLGYVGIDWVLTDDGPSLLEVNARPGLEIQNVTGIGLDAMMSKVADLKVHTPQKGVEIATSLFSPQEHASVSKHKYLYLSQSGRAIWLSGEGVSESKDVVITLSVSKKMTAISPALADLMDDVKAFRLMTGETIIAKQLSYRIDEKLTGYRVVLGTSAMQGFSIKPQHTMQRDVSFLAENAMKGDDYTELQLFDQKLYDVARQFSLSKILQPLNYLEEFNGFVDAKGSYNPQFIYDFPTKKKLLYRKNEIQQLSDTYRGAQQFVSPFGQMMYDYMDELSDKVSLIEAYKKQDPEGIRTYNERLYGSFDEDLVKNAISVLGSHDDVVSHVSDGDALSGAELQAYIRSYLDDRDLQQVKVVIDPALSARIAVRMGSRVRVVLNPRSLFSRSLIDATLAHEIDVHVMRYVYGKSTGWKIFRKGTAGYLATEEGLAIVAAERVHLQSNADYVNKTMYWRYVLSAHGNISFEHMGDLLCGLNGLQLSYQYLYRALVRHKKGVQDTGNELLWGRSKNKIYLDGYLSIGALSANNKKKLMCGKIALQYLDLL